jgi:hypothetical protein
MAEDYATKVDIARVLDRLDSFQALFGRVLEQGDSSQAAILGRVEAVQMELIERLDAVRMKLIERLDAVRWS